MSFDITLQTSHSELNKVDKILDDIATLSGVLKDGTSIIDPIFLIKADVVDCIGCNYLTVPEFGRSYFVTNISSIRNNLVEIACHVDALSSFASQIRSNYAIIHKQKDRWNLYLNDGTFRVYQNPIIITKAFPSGFTTQEFVLAVAGG